MHSNLLVFRNVPQPIIDFFKEHLIIQNNAEEYENNTVFKNRDICKEFLRRIENGNLSKL